jgi:hypothetical protein
MQDPKQAPHILVVYRSVPDAPARAADLCALLGQSSALRNSASIGTRLRKVGYRTAQAVCHGIGAGAELPTLVQGFDDTFSHYYFLQAPDGRAETLHDHRGEEANRQAAAKAIDYMQAAAARGLPFLLFCALVVDEHAPSDSAHDEHLRAVARAIAGARTAIVVNVVRKAGEITVAAGTQDETPQMFPHAPGAGLGELLPQILGSLAPGSVPAVCLMDEQAQLGSPQQRRLARADGKFGINAPQMRFDGVLADDQCRGDLLARVAACQQAQHREFHLGQRH